MKYSLNIYFQLFFIMYSSENKLIKNKKLK